MLRLAQHRQGGRPAAGAGPETCETGTTGKGAQAVARGVFSGFITGAAVAAVGAAGLAFVAGPPPERVAPSGIADMDRSTAEPETGPSEATGAMDETTASTESRDAVQGTTGGEDTVTATGEAQDTDTASETGPAMEQAGGADVAGDPQAPVDPARQGGDVAGDARDTGDATPAETDLAAPAGSQFDAAREDRPAALPGALPRPEVPADGPRASAPAPDAPTALEEAARRAAEAPATPIPDESMAAPAAPEGGASVDLGEAPGASRPRTQGPAPEAPSAEAVPIRPETPGRPATDASDDMAALAPPADTDAAPDAPTGGSGQPRRGEQPQAADVPAPEQAPVAQGGGVRPEAGDAGPAPSASAPIGENLPRAPAEADAPVSAPQPAAPAAPREETAPAAPDAPAAPAVDLPETAGVVGQAPGDLSRLALDIRTGRLPTADAPPAMDSDPGDAEAETAAAAARSAEPLPPIRRFAAEVDLPDGAPRLAVVLIDDGTMPFGPDTLAGFPFPVSVALDPIRPDAAEAMATYRALGIEVLVAADLPTGAAPQDAETASEAWFGALPETVAVIEARAGALQQDRALAEQMAGILAESGRGLVLHPQGLNTGLAIAERAAVPAAALFRSFGTGDGDGRALQGMLDRAGLRARSDGTAVVAAPLRPDLVPGLVAWGLASRDAGLALAPVSAVLARDIEEE